ncbi:hypothetical protein IWW37_003100 [Coemansia sp. RSA 2050]|nr:hypothetical protein IWW37_003100 [Coemansia sp. RSA 2050]KAJ2736435.1 hypothetical protein IW152_000796 [Coemansia sp. BCRC 34962]
MRVAVLGASRNTGRAFVEQAIEKDIRITILARSPDRLPFSEEQLGRIQVVKGDALVKEDVARTIEGADIVICSLGAKIEGLKVSGDIGVEETGVKHLIAAIKEAKAEAAPRLIMVSSTGVNGNYDVPYVFRPFYSLLLAKPHQHKEVAERAIKESGLPYTLVRPALLTSGKLTKTYRADVGVCGYTVSRSDVAHFILEQCVLENKFINASPSIAY